jgi:hypothetical protein
MDDLKYQLITIEESGKRIDSILRLALAVAEREGVEGLRTFVRDIVATKPELKVIKGGKNEV